MRAVTDENDIRLVGFSDFYKFGLDHFHGLVNSKLHLVRVAEKKNSRLDRKEIMGQPPTIYGTISCSVT